MAKSTTGTVRKKGPKKVKRRWRIPPPILRDPDAPGPEGLLVLEEYRSELGALLWKTLRSTLLWAQTEPAQRDELASSELADQRQSEILSTVPGHEVELREALETLQGTVRHPASCDAEDLGLACVRVAQWADLDSSPRTTLEFLQAGSLCSPADGRIALDVGRCSRDLANYARAESWFYRAVGLSRQVNDWETYIRAYLAHCKMMMRRGALPAARRSCIKALRRARRQGMRVLEGIALHEMMCLEYQMGRPESAMKAGSQAVEAYGKRHDDLPFLAHDIAFLWMQEGYYAQALPVFRETLHLLPGRHRGSALGSIARAAAGVGERATFEWARDQLEEVPPGPGVAEAWVEVARGALMLGEHEEARSAARFAEQSARLRREGLVRFMADAVIEQAENELKARESLAGADAERPYIDSVADELSGSLVRSLRDLRTPLRR